MVFTKKDIKKILLIAGIITILLADGAAAYLLYKDSTKVVEVELVSIIDESNNSLGMRKDTDAPELLIQEESNTLYTGNSNYDVKPLAYDNYGEVEISYNDENVNFNKAGTYELEVIAKDTSGNETSKTATIIIKDKPKPQVTASSNSSGSSSSSSSGSSGSSSSGGSSRMPEYDGMVCGIAATAYQCDHYGVCDPNVGYTDLGYTTDLQEGDRIMWEWGGRYEMGHAMVYIGGGMCFEGNYDGQNHARITPVRYDYDYVLRY